MGAVAGEHVEFVEAARVEEVLEALASEHLALLVLTFDRPRRPGMNGLVSPLAQIVEFVGHAVGGSRITHSEQR